jgi:hypothetical protein
MPTQEQKQTTLKVKELAKNFGNAFELSEALGISRATFFTRLKKDNWKAIEIKSVESVEFYSKQTHVDIPSPGNQNQEVLNLLIRCQKVDYFDIVKQCGIMCPTKRISDLRAMFGKEFIKSNKVSCENKFGRRIDYVYYSLQDKEIAIDNYLKMVNS